MKTKIYLTILLFAIIANDTTAQYFEWANDFSANQTKTRNIFSMAVNSKGDEVVAGSISWCLSCRAGFVKKINTNNSSALDFTFTDYLSAYGGANSVGIDYAGNVYVSGGGAHPVYLGTDTVNSDSFIFKLDTAGNVVWVKENVFGKLAVDSAGNVYVTNNTYTRKYDTNGHWKWNAVTLQNADIAVDVSKRVCISNADSTIKLNSAGIAIYTKQFGGKIATSKNGNAFILNNDSLIKLAPNGNILWTNNTIGGNAIAIDRNNAIYTANNTEIKKFNSLGSPVWTRTSVNAPFSFLGVDSSKNVFLAGNYNAYIDNILCPFKLSGPIQATFWNDQSFIAKINTHTPQPFQAGLFAGYIGYPYLCNLTLFSIPSFSYCLGSSSNFAPNNKFRVQISNDFFTTFYDIGTVDSAFIPASVPEGTNYRLRVVSTNPVVIGYLNTSSLIFNYLEVHDKSISISAIGNTTFCSGDSVNLTAPLHLGTYHWFRNNIEQIQGTGLNNYYAKQTGSYYCVFNGPSCDSTSNSINVIVNAKPAATIIPQGPTTFCGGGSVVLSANTGANLSYKWKKGANYITNAVLSDYTATTAGNYKVEVTNIQGCSRPSATVTVTVPCRESSSLAEQINQNLIAYPSPVSDVLNLEIKNFEEKGWVYVINSLGQTVIAKEMDFDVEGLRSIDMNGISAGIYTVIVAGMNYKEMIRVVKN